MIWLEAKDSQFSAVRKTHVCPCAKFIREPDPRVDYGPEYGSDQYREGDYGCVEDRVRNLQRYRPSLQPRCPCKHIPKCMQRAEQEVEGQAPVCEVREVGMVKTVLKMAFVDPLPTKDEKGGGEGVD